MSDRMPLSAERIAESRTTHMTDRDGADFMTDPNAAPPAANRRGSTQHQREPHMSTTTAQAPAPGQLTNQQINFLLQGVHFSRIGKDGKGFAHMEAWDIRRNLIRVFGFGGYDTEQQEMVLVSQIEHPPAARNGKSRWTVIYRATVVLTVKVNGVELGHWHGTASGDATNQPSLADAHDLAMKTADSQAFKRAAVNLGDQFGMSLYNGGSLDPVVIRSLAYMDAPVPESEDSPVQPEPTPEALRAVEQEPVAETDAQRDFVAEARSASGADTVRRIWQEAKAAGLDEKRLGYIAAVGKSLAAGPPPPKPADAAEVVEGEVVSEEEQAARHAERELRDWAAANGLDDIAGDFEGATGMPLEHAIALQIRGFLNQLRGTAA